MSEVFRPVAGGGWGGLGETLLNSRGNGLLVVARVAHVPHQVQLSSLNVWEPEAGGGSAPPVVCSALFMTFQLSLVNHCIFVLQVKSDVRRLKGIPALVSMLDNPNKEVSLLIFLHDTR